MTNAERKWEEATLNKLTNNGERIAVVESKLDTVQGDVSELKQRVGSIESTLGWLKWIGAGTLTVVSMTAIGLASNAIWAYIF